MKRRIHLLIAVLCLASISLGVSATGSAEARERLSLNAGWRFYNEDPQRISPQLDYSSVRARLLPGSAPLVGSDSARSVRPSGILTTQVETTGVPMKLALTPDRTTINADGAEVAVFTVSTFDAQGRHVPTADQLVKFDVAGGRIIGVGNGNPSSHEADKASERSLFNGYAQVIVQAGHEAGETRISARADGVAAAEFIIESSVDQTPAEHPKLK